MASTSSSSTASKKDIRDRKRAIQQPPSLPSNWDRYEDEQEQIESEETPIRINAGSNESGQPAMSKKVGDEDVIKPKSKGADFRDLITQAQVIVNRIDEEDKIKQKKRKRKGS